jgi:hypothetical protein
MTLERLPDCRARRPDASVTSASAHPELICGEFVMRPRIPVSLDPAEQAAVHEWSRRMIVAAVLFIAGLAVLSTLTGNRGSSLLASDTAADVATAQQMP